MNGLQELKDRGFIAQMSHEDEIEEAFSSQRVTFYSGFDPTANSLTVGHLIPIMAMAHLQRAGHKPIMLIGGGTTMVGDPTDRTDMRKMLTIEEIAKNAEAFKSQSKTFLDFSEGGAIMLNNADWLMEKKYIEFLREVGANFSVNKMLTAECYKSRMEKGLSFLEFNYMIMQAYDFLHLNEKYDCMVQIGGNDQWSNMLAGADLIRRKLRKPAFAVTLELLTLPSGEKMGKTAKGAVFLDPEKTSPYEFYQYFRNTADSDVLLLMKRLTFIPLSEIAEYEKLEGKDLNKIKEMLAYDMTMRVHGKEEADKAKEASKSVFGGGFDSDNMPKFELEPSEVGTVDICALLTMAGITKSKGEGRRLISQNGISLNGEKVKDFAKVITEEDFKDGSLILQKGKKIFIKVVKA